MDLFTRSYDKDWNRIVYWSFLAYYSIKIGTGILYKVYI